MPIEGYTSVTLSNEYYWKIDKHAKKQHRSISNMLERMIEFYEVSAKAEVLK